MIHFLLVDDDALFRARFRGMTDWACTGFQMLAEARNGREAIAEIERHKPDIILTDISMPIMDGIGLIEYVRLYHPAIPVIALSAFDDFHYVRASLKNGAQDYLLKHTLTTEQLLSALKTATAGIDAGSQKQTDHWRDVEEFFFLLLAGWFSSPEAADARAESMGIRLPRQGCIPIIARMDSMAPPARHSEEGDTDEISDAVLGMMRELLERSMIDMIRIARDRLLLLYPASSSGWTAAPYKEDLELTIENIRCYFGKDISFGVGDVCLRLSDLSEGYKKACTRYDDARFLDKCGFVAQGSMTIEPQALPTLNVDEAQAIASLLQSGEAVHLTQALHALFSRLENEGRYASELTFIYAELIHILLRVARSFDFAMPCDGIPPLDDFKRISDLREWFCTEFLDVHTAVRAREGRHYGDYTRAAIRYMRKNYGRKISLRDIAAELNLNASYLSRLFKEETGENLISWLNDLRLDEAERLLQAHELTIREIADRVGILNYNHFFTMFRESRGLTPSQYRKKLVESQEKF